MGSSILQSCGCRDQRRNRKISGADIAGDHSDPGVSGNTGAGVDGVKKTVEQAVGSDILFSQE